MPIATPLPVFVRRGSTVDPDSLLGSHLFPHQKRTVQWMLDVEAGTTPPLFVPQATLFGEWYVYTYGFETEVLHHTVDVIVPENNTLALGGLLAHPVGSGKTVIAAEVIKQTLGQGINVVFVPGHITQQWMKEMRRFVPGVNVCIVDKSFGAVSRINDSPDVLIVPHDLAFGFVMDEVSNMDVRRVIIDEPQEVVSDELLSNAMCQIRCPYRWLLTATPSPFFAIMKLALGFEEDQHSHIAYESMISWFVRTRCRRDPPQLCLPVPALHIHMCPVTLLWQETSVMHSHALQGDLQSTIRLSSFFYFEQGEIRHRQAEIALKGAKVFKSLDDWVTSHNKMLTEQLTKEKMNLAKVEKTITCEKDKYMKNRESVEASLTELAVGEDDELNVRHVFEDEEEPGVSVALIRSRKAHRENIAGYQRRLVFLSSISETVSSDVECLICMNQMGGRVVSMLPCLHSFCANCASQLFAGRRGAPCPVCRMNVNRKDICTFVCREDLSLIPQSSEYSHLRSQFGSKICSVIEQISQILKNFRNDKVIVFGQWHGLLSQLSSALPKEIKHCFLDGPLSRRCEIIEEFRSKPSLRVMLLSSESQSSGILVITTTMLL